MQRRVIVIAVLSGFVAGSIATLIFLWKLGGVFGFSHEPPVHPLSDAPYVQRWPLDELPQNSSQTVRRVPPAVPLKYVPPKKKR